MAIKITKISQQKNMDRVSLYSDDTFVIGIDKDLLVEHRIGIGTELDEKTLEKLTGEDEIKKALNKAYRYLSYRPRSEFEVRTKLLEKFPDAIADKTIGKLKKLHYIDDQSFVSFWIGARGNSRGPALLRFELKRKGIPQSLIDEALALFDSEKLVEDALSLVQSKRKYQTLSKEELYKKIAPFLARRGYDYSVIKNVIKVLDEK